MLRTHSSRVADFQAILHNPDGKMERRRDEIHAPWVLEGRAIQDLLMAQEASARSPARHPRVRWPSPASVTELPQDDPAATQVRAPPPRG